MDKINAGIFTFFMSNIDMKTVDYNRRVVEKFNPEKYPHHHIQTPLNHGASMDLVWKCNGADVATFRGQQVPYKWDYEVVVFLDVDCLPLNEYALDHAIYLAGVEQKLVGNIQRSNHIQNNQHVFAAPSLCAVSKDTYVVMGAPSAIPTARGDVGEEYTYAAEKNKVNLHFFMPTKFDEAPAECPSWALKDGMPVYGRGTTFSDFMDGPGQEDYFWHQFQSFHAGQQEKFHAKCEQILAIP